MRSCRSRRGVLIWAAVLLICAAPSLTRAQPIRVIVDAHASPRIHYGADRLADALRTNGIDAVVVTTDAAVAASEQHRTTIVIGTLRQDGIGNLIGSKKLEIDPDNPARRHEGFALATCGPAMIAVAGNDDSGALYGCLELARRVTESKQLPADLHFADAPAFTLRGPCIGMQKTSILPGRHVYEYPYSPELFPFFYDRAFWQEYLDFLAENRMNTLFLWNGHPFASLVKLPDYPYALEVPEDVYEKNAAMYRYIATECDRRGIRLVQMFYNIIVSKPFAERNGIDTQLAAPTPLVADYTRKSIAEFVRQYPNVGLMVCLGEALQGIDNQVQWCTQVILPGVRDGMKLAGLTEEPPIVIRTHATDARVVMPAALGVYKNLYTEAKFNGESLTTYEPRGTRQELHLAMSRLGSTHVVNVHILANLEPFRYGAPRFIKASVRAARDRLGAKGIHLYPLSYWSWPDAPDAIDPPLKQWRRDWIWFEAWARYAWNPDIDDVTDRAYWVARLAAMYGTNTKAAGQILDAYNDSGECAPRILRRFGITEGNRQAMSLGMTLDQLVNPEVYRPFPELWESQSPPGERLHEYVDREWNKQPHEGETPPQIIREVLEFSQKAVAEIDAAAPSVAKNRDEFERLRNDIHCIRAMSQNYAAKANAAMSVLRFAHSRDIADMDRAEAQLADSLERFRTLTELTRDSYRFANSMQTQQRRIPVSGGVDGKPANYHWTQLLPVYEKELADFRQRVQSLKRDGTLTGVAGARDNLPAPPLPAAAVHILNKDVATYALAKDEKVFADRESRLIEVAPALRALKGVRISDEQARAGKDAAIEFETTDAVQVLIGYFRAAGNEWRHPPELETDARAGEDEGEGDKAGQTDTEPLIRNALTISTLPPVDIYAMKYPAGRHRLQVGGTGSYLVLGFVPASTNIVRRDAGLPAGARP